MNELEEGLGLELDFLKIHDIARSGSRVIPVALQDVATGEVLFIGYANQAAIHASRQEGIAVLWSTSRQELWRKGATSGDVLKLVDIRVNCEQNSLLYLVERTRTGACHTRSQSGATRPNCYYRRIVDGDRLECVDGG
ncbi:phosphoribosyl-AMP cyclohydrolase [Dactylosporangium sp. NPDC051485]|uniref:phosphoribosyl-AMP cyclohydrolase n=1 Tax=Dactylosporangium sp. NPDC051485 TaxID=3154846 RepID=UPI0034130CD0